MEHQDWKPIVFSKKGSKSKSKAKTKSTTGSTVVRRAKPSRTHPKAADEEIGHIKRVDLSLGQSIQQARMEKGWTQKALAQKINVKPQVIAQYEAGTAIPNPQLLSKIKRILGLFGRKKK